MGLVPGQTLQNGRYRIERILGQGGFGTTFLAFHTNFQAPCVIKTPNDHLSNDPEYSKYLKRFLQEGQMLRRLCNTRNPHIVYVSELFEEAKTHCLVMDYIEGDTLYQRVGQRGVLPEAEAIKYIRQIGEALALVHQQGIIHRDANPNNIMLGNGRATLIDFGIAGEITPKTVTSKMGFSPFAPFEQVKQVLSPREEFRKLCRLPTVDIYTLAATLYYAVTGEVPMPALDRKYDEIPLDPPRQYNPHLSDRVEQAILYGLALKHEERPQSMREFLRQLEPEIDSLDGVELRSEKGANYTQLRELLRAKKWREADQETYRRMIRVVGKKEGNWFSSEDLLNFPCADLRTIDQLWVQSSNGRFGFSVQKRIYLSCGGILDGQYHPEAWQKFGESVGWKVNNNWLYYEDLTFDLSAQEGHLPCGVRIRRGRREIVVWVLFFSHRDL